MNGGDAQRAGSALGPGIGYTYVPDDGTMERSSSTGIGGRASRFISGKLAGSSGTRSGGSPVLPPSPTIPSSSGPSRNPFSFSRGHDRSTSTSTSISVASGRSAAVPLYAQPLPPHPAPILTNNAVPYPTQPSSSHSNPSSYPSASPSPSSPPLNPFGYSEHNPPPRPVRQSSLASSISPVNSPPLPPAPLPHSGSFSGASSVIAPPPISPRTSSLSKPNSPAEVAAQAGITMTSVTELPNHAQRHSRSGSAGAAGSNAGHETPSSKRTPSRQLLQAALDLAQKAVEMDQGNDVIGALEAYREAVTLLRAVMHRVGADGKDGKPRSGKAEEEGRTLRGIHDAYIARIQLLSTYDNAVPLDVAEISTPRPSSISPKAQSVAVPSAEEPQETERSRENQPPSDTASPSLGVIGGQSGERTPRASIDASSAHVGSAAGSSDAGRGIGELMMADQTSLALDSPTHSTREGVALADASLILSPQDIVSPAINAENVIVLDDLPERRESRYARPHTSGVKPTIPSTTAEGGIGIGHPTSPTTKRSSGRPQSAASPRRQRRQQVSMGLDDEADLTIADGLVLDDIAHAASNGDAVGAEGVKRTDSDHSGHSTSGSIDKTLPPLPKEFPSPIRASSHTRTSSLGRIGQLISSSTSQGTISQRRQIKPQTAPGSMDAPRGLPSSSSAYFPRANSTGGARRSRSKSQSGSGDLPYNESADDVPPLPNLRNKASFPSQRSAAVSVRSTSETLAPPPSVSHSQHSYGSGRRSGSPTSLTPTTISGSLISPVPELQPLDALHRPFHLLRALRASMDPDGPGAYLTGAIHIPSSIWTSTSGSSGLKIQAQDTKVRLMDSLLLHLEIIRHTGSQLLDGPREVPYGVPGVAAPKVGAAVIAGVGQELLNALDGMEEECDGAYRGMVKAGVGVGAWKGKKASTGAMSWGNKISNKMGNSKAMESSDKYVDLMASLCSNIQIIDDHLGNFSGPCTPAYHCVAEPGFRAIEQRLLRITDFVRVVIVPFLLDDFKQFFHRYLRAGMRYIEE